ncbi:LLM class flavin-dependent oxidoreductase [Methylocella sp. CPCC 101449]|uniref:LLM class flavin-dependent oxidoreductase n=1 Tax=Methylocella sp. CPCC 101449 TaxID=2987531 RepID=UPI0028915065|nr:LLM class flavin-dependent oxidoreductase [Methylocella sp. CPCC 101449]MDT2021237.1 LLM class flavin-dependent oxidoreductase [Methylocella sp. CPCC 101449]
MPDRLSVDTPSPIQFGVWAPYRGKWVIDPHKERLVASYDLTRDMTVSAEKAGFDTILYAQHTINPLDQTEEIQEAWTVAAAAAAITERIEIIAAIKPRLFHPVVLAKMALGIEDISHGRFAINVVNAWFIPELERSGIGFPEHDARYAYGAEWLDVVKRLMEGETVTHEGEHFKLDAYALRPTSRYRKRPVIYSGGESEPGRQLARDYSDVWLINGRPIDDVVGDVADMRAKVRPGTPLKFGITGFSITRETEAEAQAALAELFRIQDSFYDTRQQDMRKNVDPKAQTLSYGLKYNARMIGANGGTLPGFVGSYDQVAERIAAFWHIGISTYLLSFFPLIEEQENFARHVIPRVKALIGETGVPLAARTPARRFA